MGRGSQSDKGKANRKVRLWTPVFVILIAATFCFFVMGQGMNSGTSVFLVGRGYGATIPGVLAMFFSFSAALTRLFLGPIIDGGKCSLAILVGVVVLVFGTFLMSAVDGVVLFAICRILQGAGFAAATTAAATAAADVLPEERLGEGIGYYGLGQAIAMSVGPAFALFLVGTDPSSNLYVGLALVGIVGFVISLGARYERHPERLPKTSGYRIRAERAKQAGPRPHKSVKEALNVFEPRALPGAIPMAIICPTFGFGIFFAGLYGTTLGYANAGLFYTFSAISMIIVRLLSGRFMDRVAPIRIYIVAVAFGMAAFVLLFFAASSEIVFLAAGIPYGVCLGIALPLNQSVAVKNTPSERWGATNALFLLFNDLGIGLSGTIWGIFNDCFGFQASIVTVIICQVVSYIVARIVYPK